MAHVMMMSKPTKMSCVVQQVEGYQNNPPTPFVTQTDIDLLDISSLTFLLSMHIQKHRLFLFIYLFISICLFICLHLSRFWPPILPSLLQLSEFLSPGTPSTSPQISGAISKSFKLKIQ